MGKTELSLRLAERLGCAIINADSRQIYRDLPIGTAAPTAEEQARVRHYMVGTHELGETYNAGQFAREAEDILSREPAIVSGGAMLYIDALVEGLDEMPDVSEEIRNAVRQEYEQKGLTWLQEEVQRLDPNYYATVDTHNPQRLMRCLEVCRATGGTYSKWRVESVRCNVDSGEKRDYVLVGLQRDREELYDRINQRVEQMLELGLEDEARAAFGRLETPTVGYAEFFRYFRGEIDRDEAIRLIKQNSRHYAKRQMTWWRRKNNIHWINANDDIEKNCNTVLALLADDSMCG